MPLYLRTILWLYHSGSVITLTHPFCDQIVKSLTLRPCEK